MLSICQKLLRRFSLIAIHCLLIILSLESFNQLYAQQVPNVAQTKGELLSGPLAPNQGRTAVIAYHQGFIITDPEAPGSAPGSDNLGRMWDISDPRNPVETVINGMGPNSAIAAHGYYYEGGYIRALNNGDYNFIDSNNDGELEIQRVYQIPGLPFYFPNPGVPGGWLQRGLMFQPFQTHMWWSYGATNHNGVLYKRDQQLASWDHVGLTGVIGHPILLGNILYIASDQSNTGIAAYDISDSLQNPGTAPRLIGVLKTSIGGYWPEPWGANGQLYIMFPSRENGHFFVADVTDPANMHVIADRRLPSGGDPSYIQFQDNFAFMDRYKINMQDNFSVDLTLAADANGIDVSQFALPVGNLVLTGGYPHPPTHVQGMAIWAHQAEPDLNGPTVGYHIPKNEAINYPVAAPISLLIHETLRTETIINGTNFLVRPIISGTPGAFLPGRIAYSFDDVLTFTPDQNLLPNTTYEVLLPQDGIKDAVGNGMVGYSFRFSTGSSISGGNLPPVVNSFTSAPYPISPGGQVTLTVSASDPENAQLSYRYQFGDGSQDSDWVSENSITHIYTEAGHHNAIVQVRDPSGSVSIKRLTVTVIAPIAQPSTGRSSSIAFDATRQLTWTVNPDNDSVTRINSSDQIQEIDLGNGASPRNIALDGSGNAWITGFGTDSIYIIAPNSTSYERIALSYGSAPFGIVFSPDMASAYITLYGRGELKRYTAVTRQESATLALGQTPRALAVTSDGARLFVTRFISPQTRGEVWDVNLNNFLLTRTITLQEDWLTSDSASGSRGIPNYLSAVAIHPSGNRAWVTSKFDNTERGLFQNGKDLNQENTVRAIVSEIDLSTNQEVSGARRDIDNSDSPSAITFSPLGDYAFITLQGNNVVVVYDTFISAENELALVPSVARFKTGLAPQGIVFDSVNNRLVIQNFLTRDLSIFDIEPFIYGTSLSASSFNLKTITTEKLTSLQLQGKQIFYNASDEGGAQGRNRMSADGYISCASCHIDGGHDGRTWDFTGRGEGLRNTTDLRGRAGMQHGRVHWSANFDEIQDFENDIRNAFGGAGFMSDNDFISTSDTLGTQKAGISPELDALATYVSSLGSSTIPRSPYRNSDGAHSLSAIAGQLVFNSQNCTSCHGGTSLTDSDLNSSNLHNVGSISTSSGNRLGAALTGIDTPTLLGLWTSNPYFHDGSALALEEVFSKAGETIFQAEDATMLGSAASSTADYGGNYRGSRVVRFGSATDGVRWQNVDGGSGGIARLRLRYSAQYATQSGRLFINGNQLNISLPMTLNNPSWHPSQFSFYSTNITLNSGVNNIIEFYPNVNFGSAPIAIDDMRISNAAQIESSTAHSRISSLPSGDITNLLQYLRELDGSDDPSQPTPTAIPTQFSTNTSIPTMTPTSTPTTTLVVTNTPVSTVNPGFPQTPTATTTPLQPNPTPIATSTSINDGDDNPPIDEIHIPHTIKIQKRSGKIRFIMESRRARYQLSIKMLGVKGNKAKEKIKNYSNNITKWGNFIKGKYNIKYRIIKNGENGWSSWSQIAGLRIR